MRKASIALLLTLLGCAESAVEGSENGASDGSGGGGQSVSSAGTGGGNDGRAGAGGSSSGAMAGAGGVFAGSGGMPGAGSSGHAEAGGGGSLVVGSGGGSGVGGSGSTGQLGVWENVTPAAVSLDPNYVPATNFGVLDVVADPARPSDLYAFICYQGVWRSTDFGVTWRKVSTGANGSVLATGRPWTAAIDNDKGRDPSTAPALYTANGYGSQAGVFKSTDWGVSWTKYFDGQDIYSLDMDPYDNKHLVTGMHEGAGLAETTDAGMTWRSIPTGAIGKSIYPHFIDTGTAATTRKTWLAVPQVDSGTSAMTTDGGSSFQSIGGISHPHGGNQLFNAGMGSAYIGGIGGVFRTLDSGATWSKMYASNDPHLYANGVIGTPDWLYSWDDGANAGGVGGAYIHRAPRSPGTAWAAVTSPPAMNNGGKRVAATFDGKHHILVSGNWNAGIWRYSEP